MARVKGTASLLNNTKALTDLVLEEGPEVGYGFVANEINRIMPSANISTYEVAAFHKVALCLYATDVNLKGAVETAKANAGAIANHIVHSFVEMNRERVKG
ncbi:TPA: hypothetical protein ACKE3U_003753 [Klebsiella aerogenes]